MMLDRPPATAILFDNTTMTGAWIEQTGNLPEQNFIKHGRIVNNVTLAMPHPGVYLAATDPINNILQPSDLSGVGEYEIRASSVSPTVNVLCANMALKELEPLVYTAWPNAKVNTTDIPNQTVAWPKWVHDIPRASDSEWLNRTVVDDVFRWGKGYGRRPPVFPMLPMDFNLIVNVSVYESDALYLLAKSNAISNYTLCELRSWLSPNCSTRFSISGTHGAHMSAYCEDPNDPVSYLRSVPGAPSNHTSTDWRWLADEWQLSLYLNSGMSNANASRDRILTEMILADPRLPSSVPSMAEALAALVSSTLVFGSLNSPLVHYWDQVTPSVSAPGVLQQFNASIMKQEYTSSFTNNWQSAFYVVLVVVFLLNLLCLCYFVLELKGRPLTDFTDPANLFALAINSPPSRTLRGSCGGGPADRDLVMPWRVGYDKEENHYYFVEKGQEARIERRPRVKRKGRMAGAGAVRSPTADLMVDDGKEMERGLEPTSRSYQRLSNGRSWL
ncbi:hypothetical protein B0T19DRAFT_174293 [Cercophora scortea]|uniref:Uncharacterized protein n=1 Tax=Cercophora scortea TaxID=314031 RepID=A0AAE0IMK2_9PEZI|nr:hypothetical protein B0T19DRAFT_174293 [Cercophora scortea]